MTATLLPIPDDPRRQERLEHLRSAVAAWANERRGTRNSAFLEAHERRIFQALDALGEWRDPFHTPPAS